MNSFFRHLLKLTSMWKAPQKANTQLAFSFDHRSLALNDLPPWASL